VGDRGIVTPKRLAGFVTYGWGGNRTRTRFAGRTRGCALCSIKPRRILWRDEAGWSPNPTCGQELETTKGMRT
jgi:hypothetical protein